ncbi:PAX-interacting protein 1 [Aplysia californica]|uniref:PAX-interacting protein 1 n=1 Tax=Aplysia californica TaxID=6500 RepID=A0ABM0JHU8_APLCA|nr:PAX-interacting protein 1 [Aplysia californica]
MSLFRNKFLFSMNTTTTTTALAAITINPKLVATPHPPPPALPAAPAITTASAATTESIAVISMRQEAMDVVVAKIISLLLLTILSVLCGLLPLRLLIHTPHLFSRNRNSVDYFLCGLRLFSGGIYLATCFLHLLPDTREKMAAVMLNMGSRTTYAVPELLVISGFYAVVFVEQIIQTLYVKAQQYDSRRKTKRPRKQTEPRRSNQVFRSTLDEDNVDNSTGHDHHDQKPFRDNNDDDDDDDEDDDDNVLIDDEDDLSFEDGASDNNSIDSITKVKLDLEEEILEEDRCKGNNSKLILQRAPVAQHLSNSRLPPPHYHQLHPKTKPVVTENAFPVMKSFSTFPQPKFPNCTTAAETRPYQNSGPPIIPAHAHFQKHNPLHQQQPPSQRNMPSQKPPFQPEPQPKLGMSQDNGTPPVLPPKQSQHHGRALCPQQQQQQQEQQHKSISHQVTPPSSTSSPKQQTSSFQKQEEHSSTTSGKVCHQKHGSDSKTAFSHPSHTPCQLVNEVQTQFGSGILHQESAQQSQKSQQHLHQQQEQQHNKQQQSQQQQEQQQQQPETNHQSLQDESPPQRRSNGPRYPNIHAELEDDSDGDSDVCVPRSTCHVSVCVEGLRHGNSSELSRNPSESKRDKDADSGVFSTRREFEVHEVDGRRVNRISSREVSFDRISESTAALQEIQVKQVVDELSRNPDSSKAHFRSIIFILALSFHGIFEGMALGLQSMKSSVWALCFAIIVHRCVLAFKLGMDLCRGEEKQGTAFLCIGTFTLISTLGIIIGILISSGASLYDDVSVPEALLQSLATGTIFYIVFFDILFKDLEGKDDLKRVSCSFVGFSLMAIVFAVTRS